MNKQINHIIDSYSLSSMQQAMLFSSQIAPRSGIYIQQLVARLREELDVSNFRQAWNRVVSRHDILRTAFRWENLDEPVQDVYDTVTVPFTEYDWQSLLPSEKGKRFESFLNDDRKKGFNWSEPPLLRISIFILGPADYRFVWTYHHIIADGRSRQLIIDEVFQVYESICLGEELGLPQPRPYHEYIDWLRQKDHSPSETFWHNLLRGFRTPNPIGSARISNLLDQDSREKAEADINISPLITSKLRALAKENRLTLNTIVQGAWALLLSRYNDQNDIVFGVVRAGRHWTPRAGNMVGLFVYTVPTRAIVTPEDLLLDWLEGIRQQLIDVRDHEATPLVDIQKWSDVQSGQALFESLFVYYEMETFFWSKEGKWVNREFELLEDNGFPVTIDVYASDNILLKITYDRHKFDGCEIKRMLGHLKTLLEAIAENPKRSLSELPMLIEAERQQILYDWNDTRAEYSLDKLIHQVFEAQAEKTPDAIALIHEGEKLTYRDFNRRANQLAHYLISLGVGPETLVGIATERSLEMVIGLFGILKAGGAYVPLDPSYPAERLAQIVADADMPVILTQAKLRGNLPTHQAREISLDEDWEELISGCSDANPACRVSLDNLAYVIYTSGSTGKPKGVMNTHGGILNRLIWMQEAYRLTESDAVLQKTPFSFDVSVWEFFWPLMFGARLVVARPEGHRDSEYLVATIKNQEITTIHFVPSMLQIFLMAEDIEGCTSLRQVICSGEALSSELQKRFFTRSNAKLHNLYGPTEAAVDVTYWECRRDSNLPVVPIGRPVANTQIYILDRYLQPVPIGIAGELHIGGVQVARGYLNRDDLTAASFIPDPFSPHAGARLYKTGDLACYMSDGNIEYLGRLDFQVKIRGNRIELGEIEVLLEQHLGIRGACVTVREDTPGDQRLTAYIIPANSPAVTGAELRKYLGQKLPEYMIPSYFFTLDAFPQTSSGKTDRKALPVPNMTKTESQAGYVAPGNHLQQAIAGIWQEVLKIPRVGMNDNFFELGGHSLLIVQVYYRIRQLTDRELNIIDMFRFPTINALTEYLSQDSNSADQGTLERITERAATRRSAIMSRKQSRL